MNNNNIIALEKYAETFIQNNKTTPNEKIIRQAVMTFKPLVPSITDGEIEEAIKNLETRYYITMDTGVLLRDSDTYKKWYFNSIGKREVGYWDRYKRYLSNDARMPTQVIDKIDESADQIMDSIADPKSETTFSRKGLVIGAVQSGKTSNYIALMNKAADSGYKVIILLTGTIEKLRQQTQSRVDEGFIGSDSKAQMQNKKLITIGVGKYKQLPVSALTTTDRDFNIKEAIQIEGQKGPVVFVLKKNKSVLERLENWLRLHNLNRFTGKIESPLLLIDDEADNASVNTSSEDKNPTVINETIRNIIKLFSKSTYVGFTATPFANIFIDPKFESDDEDDLFPRDFIYLLEQPSNYVGPNEMYQDDGKYHYMIRENNDVEEVLPIKHKNGEFPIRLPSTLKDAIMVFFLSNAIRDARGQEKKHRSMLIHISRFINVQNDVKDKVDAYVRELKVEIQHYILVDEKRPIIRRLHYLFDKEFSPEEFENVEKEVIAETWQQIKKHLYQSVKPIQVKVVNSGTATKNLNYDEYEEGLRLIAIGGLSLARGLTLEGLMTSYFYRNTKMYDTLMQMGRWFGYRDGYSDICRLWTSTESAEWYAHVASATEELRWDIKKMAAQNKKPIEFGLRVRSAEDTPLIITAKNKMRSADQMTLRRSLNGQMVETPVLSSNVEKLHINNQIIQEWLNDNKAFVCSNMSNLKLQRPTYKDVPKNEIIKLMELLEFPYLNDLSSIVENIKKSESKVFDKWDIVLATNSKGEEKFEFGKHEIYPLQRSFDFFGNSEKFIRMSGSKKRLGQTNYATGGLTNVQHEQIEKYVKEQREGLGKNKNGKLKAASEYMYFNTGVDRNPLLVIYPIKLLGASGKTEIKDLKKIENYVHETNELVTGIALGIPDIKGLESVTYQYAINVVLQRELLGIPSNYEEDEDEDEDELLE